MVRSDIILVVIIYMLSMHSFIDLNVCLDISSNNELVGERANMDNSWVEGGQRVTEFSLSMLFLNSSCVFCSYETLE